MTIEELNEVRGLRAELERELERQRSLETAINSFTATIDGMPRATECTSRTERLATLLVDTTDIIRTLNERILEVAVRLTERIMQSDLTTHERDVLILRYVKCQSFNKIANETHLSRGYMFRVHSDALKKVT